jgi:glucosamine--fructose-6-phosphate aminotransferase (isomerizing)
MQAGLIMSECTTLCFTGVPMAQYDHGHKETAKDSVVFKLSPRQIIYERSKKLPQR